MCMFWPCYRYFVSSYESILYKKAMFIAAFLLFSYLDVFILIYACLLFMHCFVYYKRPSVLGTEFVYYNYCVASVIFLYFMFRLFFLVRGLHAPLRNIT